LSEEVKQVNARVMDKEMENRNLDSVLEKEQNVKGEFTSQLEQYKCEMEDKNKAISELQDSCEKNQKDVETLQEELQEETYVQKFKGGHPVVCIR
jgi:predicted RNase H-like nuclease (RuvC/YqgF family)